MPDPRADYHSANSNSSFHPDGMFLFRPRCDESDTANVIWDVTGETFGRLRHLNYRSIFGGCVPPRRKYLPLVSLEMTRAGWDTVSVKSRCIIKLNNAPSDRLHFDGRFRRRAGVT